MNAMNRTEPTALQKKVARIIRHIAADNGCHQEGAIASNRVLNGASSELSIVLEWDNDPEQAARIILGQMGVWL